MILKNLSQVSTWFYHSLFLQAGEKVSPFNFKGKESAYPHNYLYMSDVLDHVY